MTDACVRKADGDEAGDKASDPLVGFDLDEILHPDLIVHVLQTLWSHGAAVIDESL